MRCPTCDTEVRDTLLVMFDELTTPKFREDTGIHLYAVQGQSIFPIYGSNGDELKHRQIAYVCQDIPETRNVKCLGFYVTENMGTELMNALSKFEKEAKLVKEGDGLGVPE